MVSFPVYLTPPLHGTTKHSLDVSKYGDLIPVFICRGMRTGRKDVWESVAVLTQFTNIYNIRLSGDELYWLVRDLLKSWQNGGGIGERRAWNSRWGRDDKLWLDVRIFGKFLQQNSINHVFYTFWIYSLGQESYSSWI